jgi:hypothetical protein
MLPLVIEHQPHRWFPYLHWVPSLPSHSTILSQVLVSGKAGAVQFRARACRAYRAKTKGKVERPIRYLRENFFYGRQLLNDADLDAQLQRRLSDVTNVRQHATTIEGSLELCSQRAGSSG